MNKPAFQQLSGLLAVIKAGLRADELLVTGSGSFDLEFDPAQVCHTTFEHQLIDVQKDAYIPLAPDLFGKQHWPALAIWVREGEAMNVRMARGGTTYPMSMECDLGLQYLFLPSAQDRGQSAYEFSTRFAMTIWWKICEVILKNFAATDSSLRSTYHIEEVGIGSYRLLPPMGQGVRGFEADLSMAFKRPPWMTGADSVLVSDLARIDTEHNEKGDTGADPLISSQYTPA